MKLNYKFIISLSKALQTHTTPRSYHVPLSRQSSTPPTSQPPNPISLFKKWETNNKTALIQTSLSWNYQRKQAPRRGYFVFETELSGLLQSTWSMWSEVWKKRVRHFHLPPQSAWGFDGETDVILIYIGSGVGARFCWFYWWKVFLSAGSSATKFFLCMRSSVSYLRDRSSAGDTSPLVVVGAEDAIITYTSCDLSWRVQKLGSAYGWWDEIPTLWNTAVRKPRNCKGNAYGERRAWILILRQVINAARKATGVFSLFGGSGRCR